MVVFSPFVKYLVFLNRNKFGIEINAAGYHPRPVTPSTADGAPLWLLANLNCHENLQFLLVKCRRTQEKNSPEKNVPLTGLTGQQQA